LVQLTTILFLPTFFNENFGRVSWANRVLPEQMVIRRKKYRGLFFILYERNSIPAYSPVKNKDRFLPQNF
jgi:hypothetical protein